jgi:hypothetical protein
MPDNYLLQRVKGLRSILALAVLAALALFILAEPAAAQPEMSIPFVTTPTFVFATPSHLASLIIIETNTSQLAASDNEALAISFLPAGNPFSSGFNVAPAIAQASDRTIVCAQTYTFQDFFTI